MCQREAGAVARAAQANPDVTFVGVAAHDGEEAMSAFVGGTGVGIFPNINDERAVLWREYGVGSQPAFVFIAADGTSQKFGSLGEEKIQENINALFG